MLDILQVFSHNLTGVHVFKVDNGNTITMFDICSKFTTKTQEWRHWCRSVIFIVNFKQISQPILVFLLMTLNKLIPVEIAHHKNTRHWSSQLICKTKFDSFSSILNVISAPIHPPGDQKQFLTVEGLGMTIKVLNQSYLLLLFTVNVIVLIFPN